MRWIQIRWLLLMGLLVLAACGQQPSIEPLQLTPYPTLNPNQIIQGRIVYEKNCASCHGIDAEGSPNWATPGSDGAFSIGPPHDDSGHTWHHSDRVLYMTIYAGMGDPLRPDKPLVMPSFGNVLSDEEIRSLIVYFQSLWTEEHRQYQWRETLEDFEPTPTPYQNEGDN